MHENLEELKQDFNNLMQKLNVKAYDPLSTNVQKLVNIGMLYWLCDKLTKANEHNEDDDYAKAKSELMGAEEYYEMYSHSKDPMVKTMASQELQHANYFMNKLRLADKTNDEKTMYQSLLNWYNDLVGRINK